MEKPVSQGVSGKNSAIGETGQTHTDCVPGARHGIICICLKYNTNTKSSTWQEVKSSTLLNEICKHPVSTFIPNLKHLPIKKTIPLISEEISCLQ